MRNQKVSGFEHPLLKLIHSITHHHVDNALTLLKVIIDFGKIEATTSYPFSSESNVINAEASRITY